MLENPVLSVAFVIAATQFFKTQLSLENRLALLCAFIVSLIVGLVPVAAASFPTIAPWVNTVVAVIGLFISGAGSYDIIMAVRRDGMPGLRKQG